MSGTIGLRAVLRAGERESARRPSYVAGSPAPWFCEVRALIGRALTDVPAAEFVFVPPGLAAQFAVSAERLSAGIYGAEPPPLVLLGEWRVQFRAGTGLILDERAFDLLPTAVDPAPVPPTILTTDGGSFITLAGLAIGVTP
jgi:hypothetical protein